MTINASNLASASAARKAANKAYNAAADQFCKELSDALDMAPAGSTVLNANLAKTMGMRPCDLAQIVYNRRYKYGIKSTKIDVTRRFVEVDEAGHPIPGAKIKVVVKEQTAFCKDRLPF